MPQWVLAQSENHSSWGITASGGVVISVIHHNATPSAMASDLSAGVTYCHHISQSSFGFSARAGFRRYSASFRVNDNTTFNLRQSGIMTGVQVLILPQKRSHFAAGIFLFIRSYAMADFTQEYGNAHFSYGHSNYHSNPKQAGLQLGYFFTTGRKQNLRFGLEILQSATPLLKHPYKPDSRTFPEFEIQPDTFPSSLVATIHYFLRKK